MTKEGHQSSRSLSTQGSAGSNASTERPAGQVIYLFERSRHADPEINRFRLLAILSLFTFSLAFWGGLFWLISHWIR